MENAFLMELLNLKQGFVPVDLNTGANTGLRCSMKGCSRLAFIVQMSDSTSAAVTLTFNQHDAPSAGNSKVLPIANPYYVKADTALRFTKVVPVSATETYDLASAFGSAEGIAVFEVLAEDLDVNNDFSHVSLDMIDATAAKVGAVLVVFIGNKNTPPYAQDV